LLHVAETLGAKPLVMRKNPEEMTEAPGRRYSGFD
jgi:hypothetical protein